MADIKNLLDNIISDTKKNAEPAKDPIMGNSNDGMFDKGAFREKLSMFVLKDVISAMMHDETKDIDGMIDASITKHIHDNYNGSFYNYLHGAQMKCKSPLVGDIIQEIDDISDEKEKAIKENRKDITENMTAKDILSGISNYDDFRERLKEQVSQQVVNDVAKVVTTSNDAPVFDDLDQKLNEQKAENSNDAGPDMTTESVILRMTGNIVVEYSLQGKQMTTEEGINKAVIQYCLGEMDRLFKQNSRINPVHKYL